MSGIKLLRRNGIYYFRSKIPQDIYQYIKRREIWKSLKTDNYKTAKVLASKLLYHTERLFLHVRSGMYSNSEIKQLVKDYIHTYLNRAESLRSIGIVRYESDGQQLVEADADVQIKVNTSVKALDELIETSKNRLFLNDFSGVCVRLEMYIKEHGIDIDNESVEYVTLCREILKAEIEALKVEKERTSGNYGNQYDSFIENILVPTTIATVPLMSQPLVSSEPVVLLSKIVEEHVNEAVLADAWTEKTLAENTSIFKVMMEIIGDQDIKAIDNQMLLDFRNTLAKLPPNRDKVARYKGKTIKQILAMKNVEPMSKTTVNKYIIRIGSLFKWAAKKKFIMVNYAEGLSLSTKTNAYEERETYSKEDIQKLFTHLSLNPKAPHEYWIPLVALYEGMRLEEICQLHIADIIELDALPCISINDDGDKRVKTIAGKRIIPIHPELIKLGFIDYIEMLRESKADRVWPLLTKGRDGYSHIYGKKYQRFNRTYITMNPKRVFHSFRHTLANTLKQAGVLEIIIAEILGHANESETSGRYGKKYEPKVLLEALLKLNYGSPAEPESVELESKPEVTPVTVLPIRAIILQAGI